MDMISNLSDDLLLKIVSLLPTKDVVSTMLLSKRWKCFWTLVPRLDFDDGFELEPSRYGSFKKYVYRTMLLRKALVLETLKFDVGPCCSSEDMATWIGIGMFQGVSELEIIHSEEHFKEHRPIKLPKTLYSYEKLEVLKLTSSISLDVPIDVCFPSLKTLHLICVEYETRECHVRLLSGCPVLEELVLDKSLNSDGLQTFYIETPTLHRLSIVDICEEPNYGQGGLHMSVINVPSLKYLNFVDFDDDLCLCENMPEVVEANVKVVYNSPEKLLESIPLVKRLYLCLSASCFNTALDFIILFIWRYVHIPEVGGIYLLGCSKVLLNYKFSKSARATNALVPQCPLEVTG